METTVGQPLVQAKIDADMRACTAPATSSM